MAGGYDNNGNYARWYSWQADDVAGVGIVSDRHDTEDNEFMKALNVAFLRDGRAPATADWNMAGHIIHNLGTATTPADGDAVNYGLLTGSGSNGTPDFKKAINLTGADANGRLNFRSATGVNGIGWFGADLGWFARINDPSKARPRLVLNNLWNGGLVGTPGVDVVTMSDAGDVGLTSLVSNLSQDSNGQWRTISPGWGTRLRIDSTQMVLQGTDVVTATDPYVATTLQDRIELSGYGGSAAINLHKKDGTATGGLNALRGYTGTSLRWVMQLGTSVAEGSGDVGTEFALSAYSNTGASKFTIMTAGRNDGKVTFPQGHAGVFNVDGPIDNTTTSLILGGNGFVYLRPNGRSSTVGQVAVAASGDTTINGEATVAGSGNGVHAGIGVITKSGSSGSYGANRGNFWWSGSAGYVYIDGTAFPLTAPCDYRLKQEVKPLASTWDKVKALRPISFQYRDYDILKADGVEHWGFLAHELQDALTPSAATGEKDAVEDVVETDDDGQTRVTGTRPALQGPDPMAIIAALTAALQEAQLRIEALEARLT
jgi:Chaperone of endosialidase